MKKKSRKKTRAAESPAPRNIRRLFPHVKTVVDADESLDIEVTSEDCEKAVSQDANECALARAVRRECAATAAIIGVSSSYIIKGTKAIRFDTSERIAREVVSFDRHHDFEPGHYTLSPKSPSARMDVRNKRDRNYRANHDTRPRHDAHPPKVIGTARVRLLSTRSGVR